MNDSKQFDAHYCHMGAEIIHPVRDCVKPSFVISSECQSAQMSKITNYGLTQSGTGCYGNSGH